MLTDSRRNICEYQMKTFPSTPREDGFRMPAEFERHSGCWMLFPERPDNWRLSAIPAQRAVAKVARKISKFEKVTVGASSTQLANARSLLAASISVVDIEFDDAWIRDTGPTCVINADAVVRGIDWAFNSWGGLFESWEKDDLVAQKVLEIENLDRYKSSMVMEGGAVHVDGEGTLVTTEECILNPNRNPGMSKSEAERILKEHLGVDKVIWLPRGIYLDEAGGHVDNLCCFVRPSVMVLAWTDDSSDPQWEISREALEILQKETDARGRQLEIHKIHQPSPMFITREESEGFEKSLGTISRKVGDRLPASYIGFYISNGGVVMPSFDDPMDVKAKNTLQSVFPDRAVVDVPARELLLGGGTVHCMTQQIPLYRA